MQFIKNGPDIPDRLLQDHEDGRVVFFCGAGISRPAGFPDFGKLVKKIYKALLIEPNEIQQAAINEGRFDTAISLLEAKIIGGRETVRRRLAGILARNPTVLNATATHEVMLTLGTARDGRTGETRVRLVTTNFDRLFEDVIAEKLIAVKRFEAPALPVPKKSWDGLVYLHGLLGKKPTPSELNRLVVSSGDFGLAYLTERWAARFVSELFRNYTVCFVGYSISDPVLRYMTDALAANRLLGESSPEVFAFGSYFQGKKETSFNEWKTKNVIPILYRDCNDHAYLHKTLSAWADTYRDGMGGKEQIVVRYYSAHPSASTKQDDFVGRMLWALTDPKAAKRFAELNPVPSLDWLECLIEKRFFHADLDRFGVPPKTVVDENLEFSLLLRPAPYDLAPWMSIVDTGARGSGWDDVIEQLARWLVRHLDDPDLLLWMVNCGGQLHDSLVDEIEHRLKDFAKLERESNEAELDRIRADAPNAIPGPLMRKLWQLLLTGRVMSWRSNYDSHRWVERFERDGLTTTLQLELQGILTPRVSLQSWQHPRLHGDGESRKPERTGDLFNWKIVLSDDDIRYFLGDLVEDEQWNSALPGLLSDFNLLLRYALDLMNELGGEGQEVERSFMYRPSIDKHSQNKEFPDWTVLIDLVQDAWLATAKQSPERAYRLAEEWWESPHPLFRRLAFFAAAKLSIIPPRRALDWLLADRGRWLWELETQREAIRLLVALGSRLDNAMQEEIESVILTGPPFVKVKADIDLERWKQYKDWAIWLRLAKLNGVKKLRTPDGEERFRELSVKNPDWQLAPDQRDEFVIWSEGAFYASADGENVFVTPRPRQKLMEWLKDHPNMEIWQSDDWQKRCRDNFATTASALYALSLEGEGIWPVGRWAVALQEWSKGKHIKRSWRYMGPVLVKAPEGVLRELARDVGSWLQALAKIIEGRDVHFFALTRRVLDCHIDVSSGHDDPYTRAINHPVGCVTRALMGWWLRQSPEDGQGLPEEIKQTLTEICDTRIDKFRPGRVVLALHVIALFRVDQDWTVQHLLPLFDWQSPREEENVEAISAWGGFLWSRYLYPPLMEVTSFKSAFLDTAHHYEVLDKRGEQYAAFLILVALDDPGGMFTTSDLIEATHALPPEGLCDAVYVLISNLEGAGDRRTEFWENRITPYLRKIWPKTKDKLSPSVSKSLAYLCLASRNKFPEALALLGDWLEKADRPEDLIMRLRDTDPDLCREFPEAALEFLSRIVSQRISWARGDLSRCLETIREAKPALANDPRYMRLMEYTH